jgi:hypothetical protein
LRRLLHAAQGIGNELFLIKRRNYDGDQHWPYSIPPALGWAMPKMTAGLVEFGTKRTIEASQPKSLFHDHQTSGTGAPAQNG